MRKISIVFLSIIFLWGCSSSQEIDSKATASPEWKMDSNQQEFLKGKKPKYKVLVAYFSKTGNTQKIAYKIAVMLGGDVERVKDLNTRGFCLGGGAATFGVGADINKPDKNPEEYDLVIIGTPIWSWTMAPAIHAYIKQNKDKFKKVAFFVTAGGTSPEGTVEDMEELSGKKALAFTGFIEDEFEKSEEIQKKLNTFLLNFLETAN